MAIPGETKRALLNMANRIPAERRERFTQAVSVRLDSLQSENTLYGALAGAALGAIMEALPGVETITGIDDWVEVGAALGAWVGYKKDRRQREERERIKIVINEALRETFA